MTTLLLTLILDRELKKLNREIDSKIQRGISYNKEAQLHKQLIGKIKKLEKRGTVMAML